MSTPLSRYRRILLAILGGLLLFFGARAAFLQSRPERLRDLPNQGDWLLGIRDGIAYFQMQPATVSMLISALPVKDISIRLLVNDARPNTVFQPMQVTDNGVHYLAYPENTAQGLAYTVTEVVRSRGILARQQRTQYLSLVKADLYRIPLSGGALSPAPLHTSMRIVRSYSQADAVCVTQDRIYWIEIDSAKRPAQACGSLRARSPEGGETETLLIGLPPQATLYVLENRQAAAWMFVPAGNGLYDIYRLAANQDRPQLFLRKTDLNWITFQPATCNGRIYWKRDSVAPMQEANPVYQSEILSAALDGSDRRVVHTFKEPDNVSTLYAHADKLYIEMPRTSYRRLLRLEPGPRVSWTEVLRFPSDAKQIVFDSGYFYYALTEQRENPWDKSRRYRLPVRSAVLYRYRLPAK